MQFSFHDLRDWLFEKRTFDFVAGVPLRFYLNVFFFKIRTFRGRFDWNALPQLQQVRNDCPAYFNVL